MVPFLLQIIMQMLWIFMFDADAPFHALLLPYVCTRCSIVEITVTAVWCQDLSQLYLSCSEFSLAF